MNTICRIGLAIKIGLLAASIGSAGHAATDWPSFQAGLKAGDSNSPQKAPLPSNPAISPPAASVDRDKAAYSGVWEGWMCRDKSFDANVVVVNVSNSGASLIYAGASAQIYPFTSDLGAEFIGGELVATTTNYTLAFDMRPDGNLNVKWQNSQNPDQWCTGVLSRKN